jgi:hypothetical protein
MTNGQRRFHFRTECYAYNPTAFGTHWFTDGCSSSAPWYENGNTWVYHEIYYAHYYNWDWNRQDQATYAQHYNKIRGQNVVHYRTQKPFYVMP